MPTDPLRTARVVAGTTVGVALVGAGLIMLVTPGPGLLAIAAGTAVLSRHHAGVARLRSRRSERLRRPAPGTPPHDARDGTADGAGAA
jgi:hypothetical protein